MSNEPNSLVNNNSDDDSDDEDKRTIFCANLSEEVTEDLLYELFLQAGPIESVRIPKEPDSKRQKTFGFITYIHKCTVPYAIKLYEGVKLFKRTLTIRCRNGNNNNRRNSNAPNNNNDRINKNYDRSFNEKLIFNQTTDKILNVNRLNMEFLENLNSNPYDGGLPIDINSFTRNFNSDSNNLFKASTSSNDDKISRYSSSSSSRRHHDKPYKRSENYYNTHRHYSNKQDRSSNQRRHR